MKKIARRCLIFIIITVALMILNATNSYAKVAELEKDNTNSSVNARVSYKVKFKEKIITADMELEYNKEYLEYLNTTTENTEVNVVDNKVYVLYSDTKAEGTDCIEILFKVKNKIPNNVKNEIKLLDINFYDKENKKDYSSEDVNLQEFVKDVGANSNNGNTNNGNTNNGNTNNGNTNNGNTNNGNTNNGNTNNGNASNSVDQTKANGTIPQTGTSGIPYIVMGILGLIVLNVIFILGKNKKIKCIIPMIAIGIVLTGTLSVRAANNINIKKYNKIKNCENVLVIMPDKINRNISAKEIKQINNGSKIKNIIRNNKNLEETNYVATKDKILYEDGSTYTAIVYGDINCDGKVNSIDVAKFILCSLNKQGLDNIERKAINLCNENDEEDNIIDQKDYDRLKEYILRKRNGNIVDKLPQENSQSQDGTETNIPVNKISLNKDKITIYKGESTNLVATIEPTNATNKNVTWTSSKSNVVTVSSNGVVTGKSTGTAKIIVKTENGKIATCDVNVENKKTDSTTINLNKETLKIDLSNSNSEKLIAKTNSTEKLNWSSDNINISTVSNDGLVTGKATGQTIIRVTDSKGAIATCKVIVQTSPLKVNLNIINQTLDLSGTKTFKIVAKVEPSTANINNKISLESSNSNIASVSNDGNVIGIANGTTTIVARTSNGKEARCNVTVQTSPTGIYFAENKNDETKYLSVKKGSSTTVKAIIEPSTANVNTNITYAISSGNSKVASINATTGNISGKQAGVVTIKASLANGKSATIKLNVKIGNKVFDTRKLSNENNTKSSLLYSQNVDIGAGFSNQIASHMQSFYVASSGKIYYGSNGDGTKKDSYITYASENEISNNYMKITYFGHQSAIDVEKSGKDNYVWVDSLSSTKGQYGYKLNYIVSRMKYIKGKTYNFAMGTVKVKDSNKKLLKTYKNDEGQNFVYINSNNNMIRGLNASVDENNGLLAIYYAKKIYIYDLEEALGIKDDTYEQEVETDDGNRIVEFRAKNLNSIKKLTTITIQSGENQKSDILSYSMQGFDLDGDYIYVAEGGDSNEKGKTAAYVTVFDYMYNTKGYIPAKERKEVIAYNNTNAKSKNLLKTLGDTNKAEIEGIKVDTSGSKPVMYLGLMTNYTETGKKSANILKYN